MTGEDRGSAPTLDSCDWEGEEKGAAPPADELFGVLSNAARRRILAYLLEAPRTTFEELTDVLVGWAASETGFVEAAERETIEIGLYHVHLPVLSEAGLLAYDAGGGGVELRPLEDRTRDVIRLANQYDRLDRTGGDRADADPGSGIDGGA
jgi:DNA-binding transcriptional ArsR family regulator